MKTIAIVQGHKKQCGVYQYGLSTFRILEKSNNYKYIFMPVTGIQDFVDNLNLHRPDALIFNYDSNLLGWYNDDIGQNLKCPKFMMLGHEPQFMPYFHSINANFIISPMIRVQHERFYNIPRPVVDIPDVTYRSPGNPITIGNFGFGWYTKEYEKIIDHVNNQFVNERVILNFNIGLGDYVDKTGNVARELADKCRMRANPNVEMNIFHDFLDIDNLIQFLNNNDINIFYYSKNVNDGLVSSSTDYALAAKKPIAVNESSMFGHIISDSININKTPIKKIIEFGIEPLESIHQTHKEDNLRNSYESVFANFVGV